MELNMGEIIVIDDLGRAVYGPRMIDEAVFRQSEAWNCGEMATSSPDSRPAVGLNRRNPGLAFAGTGKTSRP
ncbi:hypothetical protein [Desulfococcus sp.]|uniref:hypothetical protein n=1 Tax=Desulfococcus sp. TaxID=2025834 RepID=UPI0035938716